MSPESRKAPVARASDTGQKAQLELDLGGVIARVEHVLTPGFRFISRLLSLFQVTVMYSTE